VALVNSTTDTLRKKLY